MTPTNVEQYDFLMLGSGEAGKYLAWYFGKAGKRTAMVERKYIGGSCPNIACLPSKNVIQSARIAAYFRRSEEYGICKENWKIQMSGVRDRKRRMVNIQIEDHTSRYNASGTELVLGQGRFIAPQTIEVALNDGGTRTLHGARVMICTGSHTAAESVPGLMEAQPLTHVEALELGVAPEHLIVVGGGFIGLEFAQAFRRFGSRVTIIERNSRLAAREDPDVSEGLQQLFADEGIEVCTETLITRVEGQSGESVTLHVTRGASKSVLQGSHILLATGRTPNTRGIGLEAAGIETAPNGYIKVNERLETTAPNVWAVGECAGSPAFTHIAFDDFRVVRDNLTGGDRVTTGRQVPACLFTDPEFARVGLSESEARQRGIPYRLAKLPMASVLRAKTLSETRGFMKALVDTASDRILGFTAFGDGAGETLATVQLAMRAGLPYTILRDSIMTHPTMAEGLVYLFLNPPVAA